MYILYKLVNNFFFCIFTNRLKFPAIFIPKNFHSDYDGVCFDFNHRTTHFGDKLFFVKVVRLLKLSGIRVDVLDRSGAFDTIYNMLYPEAARNFTVSHNSLRIIPKPAFLSYVGKRSNFLIVDLTDTRINLRLPDQLVYSFSNFFNVSSDFDLDFQNSSYKNISQKINNNPVAIFNNYIDSGKFRKFFLNESLLYNECIRLKESGYKIVHVGTANDKASDSKLYYFVDEDLRGTLTVNDLIKLLGSCETNVVVTYDNFVMHLGCVFGKKTFVLFRGRFTLSQRRHHFNFVNNAFESRHGQISYLTN